MVVLKGIPSLLSPELLYALAKMGHGDELVLADANFPVSSVCKCGPIEIRADGLQIPALLEAILKLFPLDTYVRSPAAVMDLVDSDKELGVETPVWTTYIQMIKQAGSQGDGAVWQPDHKERRDPTWGTELNPAGPCCPLLLCWAPAALCSSAGPCCPLLL
ncbi:fucose mutarotase isoform X1 [Alosa alosa]|uniref:fucose mutarotase isoform X1 n=1 Tax=Alosa sapidissima TaxID=34773 RepID=UPI001C092C53|nr:fucose mutarotase isoform X1 [Alosa sapidissima]XP_048125931.1 fucose mutarotase isoform X1 [Alosa alosa]